MKPPMMLNSSFNTKHLNGLMKIDSLNKELYNLQSLRPYEDQQPNLKIDNTFMKEVNDQFMIKQSIDNIDNKCINIESKLFDQEALNQVFANKNASIKKKILEQKKSINFLFEEFKKIRSEFKVKVKDKVKDEVVVEEEKVKVKDEVVVEEEKVKVKDEVVVEEEKVKTSDTVKITTNNLQEQVKQLKNLKDLIVCYFNTPFKIDFKNNTTNIKECTDDIKFRMYKTYSNKNSFLLYQTFSKNIFVVAFNDKENENQNNMGIVHCEVNDKFNTTDIKEIKNNDINMYKEIMKALPSITPKLCFEKPEGMKIVIIHIKDLKSSNPLYKFIRVFVTNIKTENYGDYAI